MSVPTIERTWWCRKERAAAATRISSPARVTSSRSRVRIGLLAWHSAARKVVKSWRPTSIAAASCIAVSSSPQGTCHTRFASSAGGERRLRMR